MCGDYKVIVNQAAKPDTYFLSQIDDLFTSLAGEKNFSKLDLAHAYASQQIQLDDASKELVTINMRKDLFQHTRLSFLKPQSIPKDHLSCQYLSWSPARQKNTSTSRSIEPGPYPDKTGSDLTTTLGKEMLIQWSTWDITDGLRPTKERFNQ